jgi:TonB family protein
MSDSWKDCEGQVIDGKFPLLQHLGGSDHSVVFLTQRGKNGGDKAAIKFVPAEPANAEIQLSRWKQAAQIFHANLIRLFESGRCHLAGMDLLYVVMEYAPENLAQFLPERALSPAEMRDMLEPLLETLTHLHGKGLAHGRIRPGNILAIEDQLKLSSDSLARIGEPQILFGKPDAYTAPEGSGAGSPAGDVWSLGVMVVESLTQRVPERKEQEDPKVPDSVPQPFLDIVRHSLRRDPQYRWTVAEISTTLNPPPIQPASTVSVPAAADPRKVAGVKALGAAQGAPDLKTPAPPKPTTSIDPLAVPLSKVPLLPPLKHALDSQSVAGGRASYSSYYVVVAVLVALTLGAMLAIPRLRDRQSEPDTTSAPTRPALQPETPVTPAMSQPESKPQPKQTTPAPGRASQGPAQRSALQPPQRSSQDSLKAASDKQFVKESSTSNSSADPAATTYSASNHSGADAAVPGSGGPVAATGSVTPGEILNQVLPTISDKARSTIHGTVRVLVKVDVDAAGTVTGAQTASSPSKFFGDAATKAAKEWDFAPAKIASQRVPTEWSLRFDFTQAGTKVEPTQTKP